MQIIHENAMNVVCCLPCVTFFLFVECTITIREQEPLRHTTEREQAASRIADRRMRRTKKARKLARALYCQKYPKSCTLVQ